MSSLFLVLILSKGGIRSSLETGAMILIFQRAWTTLQLCPEATSSRKPALMPPPKSENPWSVLHAQHSSLNLAFIPIGLCTTGGQGCM